MLSLSLSFSLFLSHLLISLSLFREVLNIFPDGNDNNNNNDESIFSFTLSLNSNVSLRDLDVIALWVHVRIHRQLQTSLPSAPSQEDGGGSGEEASEVVRDSREPAGEDRVHGGAGDGGGAVQFRVRV